MKIDREKAIMGVRLSFTAIYFIILMAFAFSLGCSAQKDIIRDKTVQVPVPKLQMQLTEIKPVNADSLLLNAFQTFATDSTYFESSKITEKGDKVNVKFYPKSKETGKPKFDIEIEQAPVPFTYRDTTHIVQERKDLYDYLIVVFFVALVVGIVIIIIKVKK